METIFGENTKINSTNAVEKKAIGNVGGRPE